MSEKFMTNERKNELFWLLDEYINEFIGSYEDEEGPIESVDCEDAFWTVKDLVGGDFENILKETIGMSDDEIFYFTNKINI